MFQILYLLVFVVLAILAVVNLARNLMMVASDSQRSRSNWSQRSSIPHPELLDSAGNVVNEPLMVMRSASVEDIRSRLDALYESSPGQSSLDKDEN
ncbi:MAG: DUF2973 domain-containing protein [Prochlorotrichaceae cyanobacterium]|jgi:hypothetical protein